MSQLLHCLCVKNVAGCEVCALVAREQWAGFRAQHAPATVGQFLEQVIREDRAEVVLGILWNTDLDINQPCDPERYESVSPLMTALRAGNARIVALIAGQPRFDLARSLPDYERWSWVGSAPLEVLRQYLEIPGSDVNQADGNGKTLLHEVVYDFGGQDKLAELLARPGILIDAKQIDGTTPLYRAGLVGNADAFRQLMERGADVNNRNDDNRWTILMCAAAYDHVSIAEQALRSTEIDINADDDIGDRALHIAADRGRTRIVELLLEQPGIGVNLKNHLGWTPLSKAAFAGEDGVLRLLLARPELEVNFVDNDRQTALFHAVSNRKLETVRLLLKDPRTNTGISNRTSLTALGMATALGFTEIANLIQQHEAGSDKLSPHDPYAERSAGES